MGAFGAETADLPCQRAIAGRTDRTVPKRAGEGVETKFSRGSMSTFHCARFEEIFGNVGRKLGVVSPVPNCEGPGAPTLMIESEATRQQPAGGDVSQRHPMPKAACSSDVGSDTELSACRRRQTRPCGS